MTGLRRLNILLTADAVGGVWQYALELSAALGAAGHRIILAVLGPPPTAGEGREAASLPGVELRETGLPLDWLSPGPEPVVHAAQELARMAREERVDLVHCNMPTLAGAAHFGRPVVAVTHGCVTTWWQAAKDEPLDQSFHWHREMTRAGLQAADAIAAPSASYARAIKRTYGLNKMPCVVHNGRTPAIAPSRDKPLCAALTVGRQWDRVKNAALLDGVARRLSVPFFAAGELRGPHGEEVTLTHMQALGHVASNDLSSLLSRRPVFVSGATFEPFGLAVLEAAQAGCPLVLSDISTFRELWEEAALFVGARDEAGFAYAIEQLLGDADLFDRMSLAAVDQAQRFTPTATAAAMESIYAQILAPVEAAA